MLSLATLPSAQLMGSAQIPTVEIICCYFNLTQLPQTISLLSDSQFILLSTYIHIYSTEIQSKEKKEI